MDEYHEKEWNKLKLIFDMDYVRDDFNKRGINCNLYNVIEKLKEKIKKDIEIAKISLRNNKFKEKGYIDIDLLDLNYVMGGFPARYAESRIFNYLDHLEGLIIINNKGDQS